MILDLLRHGEPQGGRLYRGSQDDALTDKGWQQMLDSTQNKTWNFIATSPLIRCADFAKHLSVTQNAPYQVFDEFQELGFGDWQGKSATEIGQNTVDQFKANPVANRPPNAEYLHDFQARVLSVFESIIQNKQHQSVLIVAHAGVIRVIKSHLSQSPIEKMFTIEVISGSCERFEI
ncbi:MAG: histidine phosphatase family protein [Gammaproteobacteria bacterium]|nr:histidine phosphatase family protein [Gammaproteobacteria bacterium]